MECFFEGAFRYLCATEWTMLINQVALSDTFFAEDMLAVGFHGMVDSFITDRAGIGIFTALSPLFSRFPLDLGFLFFLFGFDLIFDWFFLLYFLLLYFGFLSHLLCSL